MRHGSGYALLINAIFTALGTAHAESTPEPAPGSVAPIMERSADEIARELANPNTVLGSLSFNLDSIAYKGDLPGADDQSALRLTFQPSFPYPIEKGLNFFLRPAIPIVIKQDVPTSGGFDEKGVDLGDISFDVGLGKSFSNGMVLVGGVAGTLPTASDDALGLDQWLLGPELAVATVKKWGVVGLLVSHQWDVAGEDSFSTSITGGQYFYTFNVGDGWQIRSAPTFSYNHNAQSGQEWTLPVGIGVNKTMILGGTPWKFGLEYWDYVKQPDAFGPNWQIRFTVTPVVPLPWGKS